MEVERASEPRLSCHETIFGRVIMAQNEVRPPRTKNAVTVEDDDGAIVREVRHPGIQTVAISSRRIDYHEPKILPRLSGSGGYQFSTAARIGTATWSYTNSVMGRTIGRLTTVESH